MSTSMAEGGGDVGELVGERGVVVGPGAAIPDLEALAGAGDDDLLAQAGMLEQEGGDHHAPGGVEVGVERVGAEEPRELARLGRERVHALQGTAGVGLEVARRPHLHAALDALGKDDAVRQRSTELRRDGEPVLRVEAVVEGAAEGHVRRAVRWMPCREKEVRAEVEEWEEPLHPGPVSAFYPTFPHSATQLAHFLPQMSTVDHSAPPESAEKQGFRTWEVAGRAAGNLCKTACRSPFCTRPCPFGAGRRPFRPPCVPPVGRSGIPVY